MLGHFLNVAEISGRLLEDDGQEGVDSLLDIELLPEVEYFLDHAQQILDNLGFAVGEQVHEGIAISLHDVHSEVGLELDDLPYLDDAVVGLHPVAVPDVGVQLRDGVVIHRVGGLQLFVVQVRQLDRSLRDVHQIQILPMLTVLLLNFACPHF